MKAVLFSFVAGAFLVTACSQTPVYERTLAPKGAYYEAAGLLGGVNAYIYGGHTVLEFPDKPTFLGIRDGSGKKVRYQQEGRYVRFDGALPTVQVRTLKARGTITLRTPTTPQAATRQIPAALALSDSIESATSIKKNVMFRYASIHFAPDSVVAKTLIEDAQHASSIKIHGYTDSTVAGPRDPSIAMGRALAAKEFLVRNGVASSVIQVQATPAGSFIVSNETPEGRAKNRRVEIEMHGALTASIPPENHQQSRDEAVVSKR